MEREGTEGGGAHWRRHSNSLAAAPDWLAAEQNSLRRQWDVGLLLAEWLLLPVLLDARAGTARRPPRQRPSWWHQSQSASCQQARVAPAAGRRQAGSWRHWRQWGRRQWGPRTARRGAARWARSPTAKGVLPAGALSVRRAEQRVPARGPAGMQVQPVGLPSSVRPQAGAETATRFTEQQTHSTSSSQRSDPNLAAPDTHQHFDQCERSNVTCKCALVSLRILAVQ